LSALEKTSRKEIRPKRKRRKKEKPSPTGWFGEGSLSLDYLELSGEYLSW
jgi:hypothetical protein